jgi:hypothetical protein
MRVSPFAAIFLALALLASPLPLKAQTAADDTAATAATALTANLQTLLDDTRPASELSRQELKKRMTAARAFLDAGGLSKEVIRKLRTMLRADREVRRAGKNPSRAANKPARANKVKDKPARKNKEARKNKIESSGPGACTLTASPATAAPGSPIALEWTAQDGFNSGSIRQGNIVVSSAPELPSGSQPTTAPTTPSTYQYLMMVTGDSGSDTCAAVVKVVEAANGEDVIFDLTPSTLAPSETPKHMTFISSQTDESKGGQRTSAACELTYQKQGDKIVTNWKVLRESDVSRAVLKEKAWRVVNHHGNTQLCYPGSPDAIVTTGSDFVKVTAQSAGGGVAHALTFGANAVTLRARETELATQFFGVPYFYKAAKGREDRIARKEIKLDQYLDMPFERRTISDYSSLVLTFDATPRVLDYVFPPLEADDPPFVDRQHSNSTTICVTGTPTRNAELGQRCITADEAAGSKFRIANLHLQWRDSRCRSQKDSSADFCRYFGDSIAFTIAIADARFQFIDDEPRFEELTQDPESRKWIYRFSLRHLLPAGTKGNPFRIKDRRTVISGDLLKPMRQAVLHAERNNPPACAGDPDQCYIPPRLKTAGGNPETDAEYFSHFSIANGQVGFETTSLSDVTFDVNRFSLIGTRIAQ